MWRGLRRLSTQAAADIPPHVPLPDQVPFIEVFSGRAIAFLTGATGGVAATYWVARGMWRRAQQQGEAAEACTAELQTLRGEPPHVPPAVRPLPVPLAPCRPPHAHNR
jgi:hypothetical protein